MKTLQNLNLQSHPDSDVLQKVLEKYPVNVSSYYNSLVRSDDRLNDPVGRQFLPCKEELDDFGCEDDGLGEEEQMVVPNLIHRYDDRVVLLTTNACPVYCRFCLRKRYWKSGTPRNDITDENLDAVVDYLKSIPAVKDILISGGDPLMLSNSRLAFILDRLSEVETLNTFRICSRIPVTLPERVTDEFVAMLKRYEGVWFMTHFNHYNELSEESIAACRRLINSGIPVLNQTVLLKGVNDDADILKTLFRGLIRIGVKPHYLFHVDPICGVRHFATGIERGLEIMKELRQTLSSLAIPMFAIDLPNGGGKVILEPDFKVGNKYKGVDGTLYNYF